MAVYVVIVVVLILLTSTAYAGFRAAPYVPTFQRDVDRMLALVPIQSHDTIADLGAGDGRFLVSAARRYGAHAIGYELSLLFFTVAFLRIRLSGLGRLISIRWKDFFTIPVPAATVICCFLTPGAMVKLERKFLDELHTPTRVLSYAFRMPSVKPDLIDKPTPTSTPIFVYSFPRIPNA